LPVVWHEAARECSVLRWLRHLIAAPVGSAEYKQVTDRSVRGRGPLDGARGDAATGNLIIGSPLTLGLMFSGVSKVFQGLPGSAADFDAAFAVGRPVDTTCFATTVLSRLVAPPSAHSCPTTRQ